MPKIDSGEMLFSELKKPEKGFANLVKVIEGSPNQVTLEVLGIEITFGRSPKDGKENFPEISRFKEGRPSPGSRDIPRDLYFYTKRRAIATMNERLKTERSQAKRQQLNNQTKKQQPDLF